MSMWQQNSAKIARKEVEQWFATTSSGSVFLPGDGRVLPLGVEEAAAIRESTETKAVEWHVAFEVRAWIAVSLVVVIVVASQSLASRLPEPWDDGVRTVAYILYAGHGAWMLFEALQVMKSMRTLRASIALSLAGRVPIDASRTGALGKSNPIPAIVTAVMIALFAWNWLAEVVAHRGIDLVGAMPLWLPVPIVVFVWVLVLGNRWIDRSRGVGVLPPEDLAGRVRNRLDRERLGR